MTDAPVTAFYATCLSCMKRFERNSAAGPVPKFCPPCSHLDNIRRKKEWVQKKKEKTLLEQAEAVPRIPGWRPKDDDDAPKEKLSPADKAFKKLLREEGLLK